MSQPRRSPNRAADASILCLTAPAGMRRVHRSASAARRILTRLRACCAVTALIAVTGCLDPVRGPARMEVSAADLPPPLLRTPDAWGIGDALTPLTLTALLDETVSFSVALRTEDESVRRARVDIVAPSGVSGTIGADAIGVYRIAPVTMPPLPGWYIRAVPPAEREEQRLDALIPWDAPVGGLSAALGPNRLCRLWVDVHIPKGTSPGRYGGEVRVVDDSGVLARVPFLIDVLPFVLPPDERPLIVEVDHRALVAAHLRMAGDPIRIDADDWSARPEAPAIDELLLDTMRELRRHRLCPVLPALRPIARMQGDGRLSLDWSLYDRLVGPLLDGTAFADRVALPRWPLPIAAYLPPGPGLGAVDLAPLTARVAAPLAAGFAARGWLDRAYATAPELPQATTAERFEAVRQFGRSLARADHPVTVVTTLPPQDLQPFGWPDYPWTDLMGLVDVFAPPAQFYDPASLGSAPGRATQTWMGIDRPPYSGCYAIHARPADVLVLPWQADRVGASALLGGVVNDWPSSPAPQPDECLLRSGHVLLYPGACFGLDRPVASVRLKLLRQAMQNAAVARLCEERGLEYVTLPIRQALSPYAGSEAYRTHFADGRAAGWPASSEVFAHARLMMLDALRGLGGGAETADAALRRNVAWRRLAAATRQVTMSVEGVRLRAERTGGRDDDGEILPSGARLEFSIVCHNADRTPVGGTLSLAEVPAGWDVPPKTIAPIPPGQARRVVLEGWAPSFETDASGALGIPLAWRLEDGEISTTTARVSSAIAVRLAQDIAIDGDLSDWPVGRVNVLADFVPIAGSGRPRRDSMALVLRDEQYLYVGILCQAGPPRSSDSSRKGVEYDDLVPRGEELIELLIDPYGIGTRSPSDLYHIVVKRSGADLAEKGIAFDPPCGRREPWAVDLDVAVRSEDDQWMAELRIPLAAFGVDAARRSVWGFNVTRFDADSEEFSTWSAAAGNAYDPVSLGNLWLP